MAKAEAIDTGSFRVLRKLIPAAEFAKQSDPEAAPLLQAGSGWEVKPGPNSTYVAVWRGYLDLTGYNQNDLTFIPTAIMFQEGGQVQSNDSIGSRLYDLVTKNPVTDADLLIGAEGSTLGIMQWIPPGFSGSLHEMEGVMHGTMRLFSVDNTLSGLVNLQGTQWGLGDATAGDRLYITRVLTAPLAPLAEVWVPPTCVVAAGTPIEEAELQYMNRLRRSFEQQWTPDVD